MHPPAQCAELRAAGPLRGGGDVRSGPFIIPGASPLIGSLGKGRGLGGYVTRSGRDHLRAEGEAAAFVSPFRLLLPAAPAGPARSLGRVPFLPSPPHAEAERTGAGRRAAHTVSPGAPPWGAAMAPPSSPPASPGPSIAPDSYRSLIGRSPLSLRPTALRKAETSHCLLDPPQPVADQ